MLDRFQYSLLVTHELTLSIRDKSLIPPDFAATKRIRKATTSEQHADRHLRWASMARALY